jgi:hypothetical protein
LLYCGYISDSNIEEASQQKKPTKRMFCLPGIFLMN